MSDNPQDYTGQQVVDQALSRLGGYANAVDPVDMLGFINEGKNELWSYLKGLRQDYFGKYSQNSDDAKGDYFGDLSISVREYPLPNEAREIKAIEITTPGFEQVIFSFKDMSHPMFREARLSANASGAGSGAQVDEYLYDQIGTNLVLAQYPSQAMSARVWYIAAIPDLELDEAAVTFLFPFFQKLANFGAKRATLGLRDSVGFQNWAEEWKKDLQSVMAGAATRNIAEPVFAQEFLPDEL